MAFAFSKTYTMSKPQTMEEVQKDIDSLTHSELMIRLMWWLEHMASYSVGSHYAGGQLTPNGMRTRAMAIRLGHINGVEHLNKVKQELARRDAEIEKENKEVEAVNPTPTPTKLIWIDCDSYKKLCEEMSITRALLTTYHVLGCVPLRTVTPEEMKDIAGQEL